jgi:hypothetical protein
VFVPDESPPLRRCGRCGDVKPFEAFAWRRIHKGQRDNYCRPCRAAYKQEHYLANKQRYVDRAATVTRRVRLERTLRLIEYFRSHPCVDCGETDPVVLEFDHLRDKRFDISNRLVSVRWESVLQEIAKCEVVCANCHRRRTMVRRRALRVLLTAE